MKQKFYNSVVMPEDRTYTNNAAKNRHYKLKKRKRKKNQSRIDLVVVGQSGIV